MPYKHYFTCGNTAQGFENFFSSNLMGLSKIYILKGGPGTGKSTLMKTIGNAYENEYEIEAIHCSSDPDSLDGIIIRALGIAIVDGTAPHVIEPLAPGALEEYVNLGVAWDIAALTKVREAILFLQQEIAACYPKAYEAFAKAKLVHDEWENIYIRNMDFTKANELTNTVITALLKDTKLDKIGIIYHRFFGASTYKGAINYLESLTLPFTYRYFIKGRPGSGKSTLLKKLQKAASDRGLDVEVYHCGFDANSLDMLIMPELSLCIFDSTAPHEFFPDRQQDCILDMYAEAILEDTDELYSEELKDISTRYKVFINEGTAYLAKAKKLHDQLESYYIAATDFNTIDAITQKLLTSINAL